MQDNIMQPAMQPFIKLAQANIELLTKFSTSPEVISQSMGNAQKLFQQAQETTTSLFQSNAFSQLMRGTLRNYTDFIMELSQSGMAVLAQGQAAMMRQAQEVSENVVDVSEARGRRSRQAV